nr:ATP-binding protein [uncultured Cellulosilyticum sp.]
MKKNKWSMKWQLLSYLAAFVGALLIILWLFQVIFLNDFYENIKVKEIKKIGNQIGNNINNSQIVRLISQVAEDKELCIVITDEQGYIIYVENSLGTSSIYPNVSREEYKRLIYKAKEDKNSTAIEKRPYKAINVERSYNRHDVRLYSKVQSLKSVVYTKVFEDQEMGNIAIFINGLISPIDATVQTIREQLMYVTLIMLVMACFLAFFIAKKMTTPISHVNNVAKSLATHPEEVAFNGKGYKEIAELSATLNYAARELTKTENLRKELIANVSHDLRTPLTLITGYAEMMRDLPGENTPENNQIIIDESKRLSQLVNDMLDLSRLQSGTSKLTYTTFNLTESIRQMLKRYNALTEQEGYQIDFLCEEEVEVKADELRISQVLYNLINNAINYTGEDKKVVVKQIVTEHKVRIEVIDTGEGIAKENIPYIWDRYYKVDKTHKRAAIGTGLGLSIVRSILDSHGATYGVESESGKGSMFWFEMYKNTTS